MKFCLSSRQKDEYLKKADQILFQFRDRNIILEYSEKYPKAELILDCPDIDLLEESKIKTFETLLEKRFILRLHSVYDFEKVKKINKNIRFFHVKDAESFYELRALKLAGVCYVSLAAPLYFDLEEVFKIGIPILLIPNQPKRDYFPRENEICGPWFRPEDVGLYDKYVDVISFEEENDDEVYLKKERALFRIYAEEKKWRGPVSMIVSDIGHPALNRLISPSFGVNRLNCRQRCQRNSSCHLCQQIFDSTDLEFIEKIKK